MAVELVHLGTGHALPDAARGPTATLLSSHGVTVLVDAGSGTLQKLHAAGAHLLTLDALVLTHAHLDHIADVAPLLFALAVPGYVRTTPLQIWASPTTHAYIDGLRSTFGRWVNAEHAVSMHTLEVGLPAQIAGFDVATFAVNHTASSVGLCLTAPCGARVAIPGDTGPHPGLASAIAGADYAVLECSLPDAFAIDEHLTPSSLLDLVDRARPRRVAVVHRYPLADTDEVSAQLALSAVPLAIVNDMDRVRIEAGR